MKPPSGSGSVFNNQDYEVVGYVGGNTYPASEMLVARHKATGRFWGHTVAMSKDDSWDVGEWFEVEEKTKTVKYYARRW